MGVNGYAGNILWVDLSTQKCLIEPLPIDLIMNYVGGRGFGAKILYDNVKRSGMDAFDPDNIILFCTGPLCSTAAQSVSRWVAISKSPLTNGFYRSVGGGDYGGFQKNSGFDVISVKGRSEEPVLLYVDDGKVKFIDAREAWGMTTTESDKILKEKLSNRSASIALIGPAGEKLVRFAGIFNLDRDGYFRSASRGGLGAVMGSKKLKGIAVHGTHRTSITYPDLYNKEIKEQVSKYRFDKGIKAFMERGTQISEFTNVIGIFPTKNFREGVLPNFENIDSSAFDKVRVGHGGCFTCSIRCGNITLIQSGKYATKNEGPEYETIWAFTGSTGSSNLEVTAYLDKLCDDLGLDTISTGVVIGLAYELYDRGILDRNQIGFDMLWGDPDPMVKLVPMIAFRTGIGNILAEGAVRASKMIGKGAKKYAMHNKGLELPAYDPRGAKAQGLSMCTSNIGGNHTYGYSTQELFASTHPWPVDRLSTERKGELTKWNQDSTAVWETGVGCSFPLELGGTSLEWYARILYAITGIKEFSDAKYLWKVGERICNLERMFNVREGFRRSDDIYPERIIKEPLPSGPSKGQVFEQDVLLDQYYEVRGWDISTGIPTDSKLTDLGLDFTLKVKRS